MVKFIARIDVQPGKEQLVADALRELAIPSRQEPGCILYDTCRIADDPTQLLVFEEWESQTALDLHMATPHFQGFLGKVGECLAGEVRMEVVERL